MRRLSTLALLLLCACQARGEEHLRKAQVFFAHRDFTQAEAEYQRALADKPEHPEALLGLGNVAFERGRPAEAITFFERTLAAAPRHVNAWHRLAIAQASAGDPAAAMRALERALAVDPNDVFALYSLAGLVARKGDAARAVELQQAALRFEPEHRGARFALAQLLVDQGRYPEAERELSRLTHAGAPELAQYGYARVAALKGDAAGAAAALERVLDHGLSHPERVLADPAFARAWSHPAMEALRPRLLTATTTTSTGAGRPGASVEDPL